MTGNRPFVQTLRVHRPVLSAFGDNAPVDCACGPDAPEDVTGWDRYEEHLAHALDAHTSQEVRAAQQQALTNAAEEIRVFFCDGDTIKARSGLPTTEESRAAASREMTFLNSLPPGSGYTELMFTAAYCDSRASRYTTTKEPDDE